MVHMQTFISPFRLSDGAWIMTSIPVADFGVWKEWLGSLRAEQLSQANLVVIVQEPSENPGIPDAGDQRLEKDLILFFLFFNMLHLPNHSHLIST